MEDAHLPVTAFSVAARIPGVSWGKDVVLNKEGNAWVASLTVERAASTPHVPLLSSWYCLIDKAYPYGSISFFPSVKNGVTATFHHQERNRVVHPDNLWLSGKPCLTEPFGGRLQENSNDPIGDSDSRLAWYTWRLLEWLDAAASDKLIRPGDHYELPQYPEAKRISEHITRIVHDESCQEFSCWRDNGRFGQLEFGLIDGFNDVLCIASFSSFDGSQVIRRWRGRSPLPTSEVIRGFWILAPASVVLPPWQAPETWGELRAALRLHSMNLDSILKQIAPRIRDKGRAILLIGFPIPLKHDDMPQEIFWSGFLLPILTKGGKPANGFRPNETGFWVRDRSESLSDCSPLNLAKIDNWDKSRLCSRGRLPEMVHQACCAIIGLGALGSQIAVSMARMGCEKMVLVDADPISAGNVARHIATLRDVGTTKAELVGNSVKLLSPHIEVSAHSHRLSRENSLPYLGGAEIVVDCSADYEVCRVLESTWFPLPKIWVCACIGYGATRIYIYVAKGHSFPANDYFAAVSPWLDRDKKADPDFVEGAGCWHPVFPARQDDMLLATAICTKVISETSGASIPLGLQVFEHSQDGGLFSISRIHPSSGGGA